MRTLRDAPVAAADAVEPLVPRVRAVVDELRAVGLEVRLTVTGTDVAPPAGIGQLVERVVRETLINVLKHDSAGQATVDIAIDDEISVRVGVPRHAQDRPEGLAGARLASTGFGLQ